MNFQYALDVLCGSLNRACNVKKLFQYMGLKNSQSPIKVDFIFVNGTSYYDKELNRTFWPSRIKMFSCNESLILPHISRKKCTCMVCRIFNREISLKTVSCILIPHIVCLILCMNS